VFDAIQDKNKRANDFFFGIKGPADSFHSTKMRTRSSNASVFMERQIERILDDEVMCTIKWSVLSPGDGTFPEFPTPEEAGRILRLKHCCYCNAAGKYKQIGVFSSRSKRVLLKALLLRFIRGCDTDIAGWNQYKQIRADIHGRMSRAEVQRSVFRALLNGFKQAKLSDVRLGKFDDAESQA
jgi:hypothetical protein